MIKLTTTESKVLQVIKKWQNEYRNSPNTGEIARALDCHSSTVIHSIHSLQLNGFIDLQYPDRRRVIIPLYWE